MTNKLIVKIVTCGIMAMIVGVGILPGCGTSSAQYNSYAFLARVNEVDPTPFFYTAYQAFQVTGLTTLTTEQQEALNNSSSNNTNNTSYSNLTGLTAKRAAK